MRTAFIEMTVFSKRRESNGPIVGGSESTGCMNTMVIQTRSRGPISLEDFNFLSAKPVSCAHEAFILLDDDAYRNHDVRRHPRSVRPEMWLKKCLTMHSARAVESLIIFAPGSVRADGRVCVCDWILERGSVDRPRVAVTSF